MWIFDELRKLIDLVKFGIKHENILVKIYSFLYLGWWLMISVVLEGEWAWTIYDIIVNIMIYFIFILPPLVPLYYFKTKKTPEISKESEAKKEPTYIPNSDEPKRITRKCPNCGAKLTDLNFYKLKSGTDTRCDYCDEIILGGS
ncbi:MAG: hypothetical protein ACE5J5_05285 [Candidatus Hydrothermarchaeales archaeon]